MEYYNKTKNKRFFNKRSTIPSIQNTNFTYYISNENEDVSVDCQINKVKRNFKELFNPNMGSPHKYSYY